MRTLRSRIVDLEKRMGVRGKFPPRLIYIMAGTGYSDFERAVQALDECGIHRQVVFLAPEDMSADEWQRFTQAYDRIKPSSGGL